MHCWKSTTDPLSLLCLLLSCLLAQLCLKKLNKAADARERRERRGNCRMQGWADNAMFKQVAYFHSLEENIQQISSSSQALDDLLGQAYSPPYAPLCSLSAPLDCSLRHEQHLQATISNLRHQVLTDSFLPARIEEGQVRQIQSYPEGLPSWFSVVLDEEYQTKRPAFSKKVNQLFRVHQLEQKSKRLGEQRERMVFLQEREQALSQVTPDTIDLLQQVRQFQDHIQHLRKSYQHFCTQIAQMVVAFVKAIIAKSKGFKETTKPTDQYQIDYIPKAKSRNAEKVVKTESRQQVENKCQGNAWLSPSKYYDYPIGRDIERRVGANSNDKVGHVHQPAPVVARPPAQVYQKQSSAFQSYRSPYSPCSNHSKSPHFHHRSPYLHSKSPEIPTQSKLGLHHLSPQKQPQIHQHTCSREGLARVSSAQTLIKSNSRFDFRSVLGTTIYH